jgi:hypothetical protein
MLGYTLSPEMGSVANEFVEPIRKVGSQQSLVGSIWLASAIILSSEPLHNKPRIFSPLAIMLEQLVPG